MPVSAQESILDSVKKIIGLSPADTSFDQDIILHINSVLVSLNQMGVGYPGFVVTDRDDSWSNFLENNSKLEMVKSYVALKVRLIFDPPQSAAHIDAINAQIKEFEWRAYTEKGGY